MAEPIVAQPQGNSPANAVSNAILGIPVAQVTNDVLGQMQQAAVNVNNSQKAAVTKSRDDLKALVVQKQQYDSAQAAAQDKQKQQDAVVTQLVNDKFRELGGSTDITGSNPDANVRIGQLFQQMGDASKSVAADAKKYHELNSGTGLSGWFARNFLAPHVANRVSIESGILDKLAGSANDIIKSVADYTTMQTALSGKTLGVDYANQLVKDAADKLAFAGHISEQQHAAIASSIGAAANQVAVGGELLKNVNEYAPTASSDMVVGKSLGIPADKFNATLQLLKADPEAYRNILSVAQTGVPTDPAALAGQVAKYGVTNNMTIPHKVTGAPVANPVLETAQITARPDVTEAITGSIAAFEDSVAAGNLAAGQAFLSKEQLIKLRQEDPIKYNKMYAEWQQQHPEIAGKFGSKILANTNPILVVEALGNNRSVPKNAPDIVGQWAKATRAILGDGAVPAMSFGDAIKQMVAANQTAQNPLAVSALAQQIATLSRATVSVMPRNMKEFTVTGLAKPTPIIVRAPVVPITARLTNFLNEGGELASGDDIDTTNSAQLENLIRAIQATITKPEGVK